MGDQNTAPRKINKVEGAAGQVIRSEGPGICESWSDDFPQKLKRNTTRWNIPGWQFDGTAASTSVMAAGRLYYCPIFVTETTTYIRISVNVKAAGAGGSLARLGLYEWNDGLPGDVILDAGTVATDAVAIVQIVINQQLTRGYYYTALVCDDATVRLAVFTAYEDTIPPVIGHGSNAGSETMQIQYVNGRVGDVAGGLQDPAVTPTNEATERYYVWLREN